MIGKMLGNRYEILEKLGGGGMAIVYKARDTSLGRYVTLKILRPEFTSDEEFIKRFKREATAVARLSHPNIVSIHDVGQEDGVHYLVMEYIQGDNLKNFIRQKGQLSSQETINIAVQICEALEHAHYNNIVHRDVKPHNILIAEGGRAKLTDFGIALESTAATITRTDTIMGSVHYISPEQAKGEITNPKSDIYSLGVVIYEMLAGEQPFTGDSPISVALKHIREHPRPLEEISVDAPPALVAIVNKAMQKKPQERFTSAEDMSRYLRLASEDFGHATVVLPVPDATDIYDPDEEDEYELPKNVEGKSGKQNIAKSKSNRKLWVVVAVALMLLGLASGTLYSSFKQYIDNDSFKVPSVLGKTQNEAESELTALGLNVLYSEPEYSEEMEEGLVVRQSIGPDDAEVKASRDITLTLSKGRQTGIVPNLYGKTEYEAEHSLKENGLKMAHPSEQVFHDDVTKGNVVAQSIANGEEVPLGTEVRITISKGSQFRKEKMPSLVNYTVSEARSYLEAINLKLNDEDITHTYDENFLDGQIIEQSPLPNAEVTEQTKVSVLVNSTPKPAEQTTIRISVENEIPDDGESHLVEIIVEDIQGINNVHYSVSHEYGDKINEEVPYTDDDSSVKVFIDGVLNAELPL